MLHPNVIIVNPLSMKKLLHNLVVEKLKEIMEDIENSIMNFKKEQREK